MDGAPLDAFGRVAPFYVGELMPFRSVKVKVLQGFVAGPGQIANPGDIIELPEHAATRECAMGRVTTDIGSAPAAAVETVQVSDPQPQTRDPQVKRGK